MSRTRVLLAATAALALVVGCGKKQEAAGDFEGVLDAGYVNAASEAVDLAALAKAIEALTGVAVEYGAAKRDDRTGATVVEDLRFFVRDYPDGAIIVEETLLWDIDADAVAALAAGEAEGVAAVADRALFIGMKSEGVTLGDADIAISAARIGVDDLALRVVERNKGPEDAPALGLLSGYAALALAMDYAEYAIADGAFSGTDAETGGSIAYEINYSNAKGVRGGTIEETSMRGLTSTIVGAGADALEGLEDEIAADADAAAAVLQGVTAIYSENFVRMSTASYPKGAKLISTVESFTWKDIDISGGLAWLARLEVPPVSETELMDFGSYTSTNQTSTYNGEPFFSVAEQRGIANDFHWLVPSDIRGVAKGVSVHIATFLDMTLEQQRELGELSEDEMLAVETQFAEAKTMIEKLGLSVLEFDGDFAWAFDGASGDAQLDYTIDAPDLLVYDDLYSVSGPTLEAWAAYAEGGFDETDQAALLGELEIRKYRTAITDRTLIDKALVLAAEQMGATPEDVRISAPAMIRVSGAQLASMDPRLPEFVEAVAAWVESGGTLTVSADPAEPQSLAAVIAAGQGNPIALIDLLNISVTQTGGEEKAAE